MHVSKRMHHMTISIGYEVAGAYFHGPSQNYIPNKDSSKYENIIYLISHNIIQKCMILLH